MPTAASSRDGLVATSPLKDSQVDKAISRHRGRTFLDAVWAHRIGLERDRIRLSPAMATTEDVGEIRVLQKEGDLALAANLYDLRDVTLRFEPSAAGGYDVRRVEGPPIEGTWGSRWRSATTTPHRSRFRWRFRTRPRPPCRVVNSDGNLTFEEGNDASTRRHISRYAGPPRVAPFLADLDPSAGGAVLRAPVPMRSPSPGVPYPSTTRRPRWSRCRSACCRTVTWR